MLQVTEVDDTAVIVLIVKYYITQHQYTIVTFDDTVPVDDTNVDGETADRSSLRSRAA